MARKDANPGGKERVAVRQVKALEMRIAGESYRTIAAACRVSVAVAFADVQKALLEATPKIDPDTVQAYRALQDERLAFLWRRVAPLVDRDAPDLGAVARAVQIEARRAALWGLDAPQKTALTDPTGTQPWHPDRRLAALPDAQLAQLDTWLTESDHAPDLPVVH